MAITKLVSDSLGAGVGGSMVKLAKQTASSDASISFDGYFSATYTNYILHITDLSPASDGQYPKMRFRINNSDASGGSYVGSIGRAYRTSGADAADISRSFYNQTEGEIAQDTDNVAAYTYSGIVNFINPLNTTTNKKVMFDGVHYNTDASVYMRNYGTFTYRANTTALSGFTLFYGSGNVERGTFTLYGVTD